MLHASPAVSEIHHFDTQLSLGIDSMLPGVRIEQGRSVPLCVLVSLRGTVALGVLVAERGTDMLLFHLIIHKLSPMIWKTRYHTYPLI